MQWAKNKQGFTIVELLIVVVVIAILAAITIVSYNGITRQAYYSKADSEVVALAKRLEMNAVNTSSYPLEDVELKSIVEAAGVWGATRSAYWTYLYCSNGSSFAILPRNSKIDQHDNPVLGDPWRFYTLQGGWSTFAFDPNASPSDTTMARDACASALSGSTWQRWLSSMV